ncbi:unnamed protein product [Timema podura]|uniref:Uncharacterized protein n=1 Tax=Timema podura TaxID=61482 RepID=A0ABN7NT39_TIMPD|nr:unnamed protein product [Timema podura]
MSEAPCRIWDRGPPYCDCDGCDRMSKRGLRMRAGWRHDWNSTSNEFVRVIIPGPFSEPALVTSSPFVFLSTDHRARRHDDCSRYFPAHQRRCAILRSGIPDPWAEYLTLRGVPQVCRRANPEEVHLWRDHLDHVESLWGRLGLSLAQGIPDPWKNWPKCCSSQKRRPDACQSLKTRSPRTCRNRSNSCDSFLMQREAELPFYDCGDPKDMRAKSDSVLICKPIKKNEWHGPKFNIDEFEHRIAEERFLHKEVEKHEYGGNRIRPFIKGKKKPIKRDLSCCCNDPNHVHTSHSCCSCSRYSCICVFLGVQDENCNTHPHTAMVYKFRPSKPLTTMSLVARALGEMILSPAIVPLLPLPRWWRKGGRGGMYPRRWQSSEHSAWTAARHASRSLFTSRHTRSQVLFRLARMG